MLSRRLSLLLVLTSLSAASFAQTSLVPGSDASLPGVALMEEARRVVEQRLPGGDPATVDRTLKEFGDHLRRVAPSAGERLARGTLDKEELRIRLDSFLVGRVARPAATALVVDPTTRVAALIEASAADLAMTAEERRALAERFTARLGERSQLARQNLLSGAMSDDELKGRLAIFLDTFRQQQAAEKIDPATASLPALVDSFLRSSLGSAPERAHAIAFSGTIEQAGKTRNFVIFKKRPNRMRMHLTEDGVVVGMFGFDGTRGWSQGPGQPAVTVVGSAEDELKAMAEFDPPLLGYAARGARIERMDGGSQDVLRTRLVETDGAETVSTIDLKTMSETAILVRRPGSPERETRLSDHRKVGSLSVAHRQEQWAGGKLDSTTRIERVTLDAGLVDVFFERPASAPLEFMTYMRAARIVAQRDAEAEKAAKTATVASAKP